MANALLTFVSILLFVAKSMSDADHDPLPEDTDPGALLETTSTASGGRRRSAYIALCVGYPSDETDFLLSPLSQLGGLVDHASICDPAEYLLLSPLKLLSLRGETPLPSLVLLLTQPPGHSATQHPDRHPAVSGPSVHAFSPWMMSASASSSATIAATPALMFYQAFISSRTQTAQHFFASAIPAPPLQVGNTFLKQQTYQLSNQKS